MQQKFSRSTVFLAAIFALLFATQACELLQKRDSKPDSKSENENRNFRLLSYIFIDEFALSEASDPGGFFRNNNSKLNSATLVATKNSTFEKWHNPESRCYANDEADLDLRIKSSNAKTTGLRLKSDSSGQEYVLNPLLGKTGLFYGAIGWLPTSLYSFTQEAESANLSWQINGVPVSNPSTKIEFFVQGEWMRSSAPDLNPQELITIHVDRDFKIRAVAPEQANYVYVVLNDNTIKDDGYPTYVRCYGKPDEIITIPPSMLANLSLGSQASLEIRFVNTILNKTHHNVDEIFIQSSTRHGFGQIYDHTNGSEQHFGTVMLSP